MTLACPKGRETGMASRLATVVGPIQGQLLRQSRRREAALFLHQGRLWVADFFDGHGEIVDAISWVRFNCDDVARGGPRVAEGVPALSLSPLLAEKLELQLQTCGVLLGQEMNDERESPTDGGECQTDAACPKTGIP